MKVKVYAFLSDDPDNYICWDADFHAPQLLSTVNGVYNLKGIHFMCIDCMPNVNTAENVVKTALLSGQLKGE